MCWRLLIPCFITTCGLGTNDGFAPIAANRYRMLWMSAFHPGADIAHPRGHVSFVPKAEVAVAVYSIKSLVPRDGTARHSGSPALRTARLRDFLTVSRLPHSASNPQAIFGCRRAITMTSGRTGHWTKMHQSLVKFSESEASNHTPSLADFTTTTPELKFSVHTPIRSISSMPARCVQLGEP